MLIVKSGAKVASKLAELIENKATTIGEAAYRKVLAAHTYNHRAEQLEKLLNAKVEQQDEALA